MLLKILLILPSLVFFYYLIAIPLAFLRGAFKKTSKARNSIMLIFGSGGHTTEILMTFRNYDFKKWKNVYFVKAETDKTSENKIRDFIKTNNVSIDIDKVTWLTIPRSREVGQSYSSSIFTTIKSTLFIYYKFTTLGTIDLVVCNGPGTCVPVVFILLLNRMLLLTKRVRIIFIESFCRVNTLSLSGKILYRVADKFLVHWKELAQKYPKAEYVGTII